VLWKTRRTNIVLLPGSSFRLPQCPACRMVTLSVSLVRPGVVRRVWRWLVGFGWLRAYVVMGPCGHAVSKGAASEVLVKLRRDLEEQQPGVAVEGEYGS
jgi:hypothetical protein